MEGHRRHVPYLRLLSQLTKMGNTCLDVFLVKEDHIHGSLDISKIDGIPSGWMGVDLIAGPILILQEIINHRL